MLFVCHIIGVVDARLTTNELSRPLVLLKQPRHYQTRQKDENRSRQVLKWEREKTT
jgi:hypothetical protein